MKSVLLIAAYLLTSVCVSARADPGPEALKAHIQKYRQAFNEGDVETSHQMIVDLIPNAIDIKPAISPYEPDEKIDRIVGLYTSKRGITVEQVRMAQKNKMNPGEIIITAATVQDLVEYKKGGDVYHYFPQGARGLALDGTLKSGTRFYRATIGDPSEPDTTGIDLIYWNGQVADGPDVGWKSLGPLWMIVPPQASLYPPGKDATSEQQDSYLEALKSRLSENQKYIQSLEEEQRFTKGLLDRLPAGNRKASVSVNSVRLGLKTSSCEQFSKTLEDRIKTQETVIKLSKFNFLIDEIDMEAIKKSVVTRKQIEKLEEELKHLKVTKAAKLKIINSQSLSGREYINTLQAEVNEIDTFLTKKEAQISQLKAQLK